MVERFPQVAGVTEENVAGGQQRLRAIFREAAARFREVAERIPGIHAGTVHVARPGTARAAVEARLGALPWIRHERESCDQYVVGVARDCWDFSVVVPKQEVLQHPRWSVVIPSYKAASTLPRALRSVLRQTEQSFEIIVVDDGSHDDTAQAIASFHADGRVRLVRNFHNKGQSAALNRGLTEARGDWLVQLDAVDWLERECLARLAVSLSHPDTVAAYGSPRIWTGRNVRTAPGREVATAEEHFSYPEIQAPRAYAVSAARALGGWSTDDGYRGRYYDDRRMLARMHDRGAVHYAGQGLYNVCEDSRSLARSSPLDAAAAKLAILVHEANARGLMLDYRMAGGFLRAVLKPYEPVTPFSWSVIIPHHNQWEYLSRTLWSWAESDLPPDSEIIVVDDASAAAPPEQILEIDGRIRLVFLETTQGPAAARNAGARAAAHDYLIFSDADHLVPPHICSAHRNALSRSDALSCGGVFARRAITVVETDLPDHRRREILEFAHNHPLFEKVSGALLRGDRIELVEPGPKMWKRAQDLAFDEVWSRDWGRIILHYGEDLSHFRHAWLRVGSGNMAISRPVYERLGGFDEAFRSKEDWEFGVRAQQKGVAILANLQAETLHQLHQVRDQRPKEDWTGAEALARKHSREMRALSAEVPASQPPGAASLLCPEVRPVIPTDATSAEIQRVVALTFDDGPHPTGTPMVLDALRRWGSQGTFFVLGSKLSGERDLLARIAAEGHELAVHGWNHAHPTTLSTGAARAQVEQGFAALADATGVRPRFFRPPYGWLTAPMAEACRDLELDVAGYDISPCDWRGDELIEMMKDLISATVAGSVCLLHDGAGDPVNTVRLVDWLLHGLGPTVEAVSLGRFAAQCPVPRLEQRMPKTVVQNGIANAGASYPSKVE